MDAKYLTQILYFMLLGGDDAVVDHTFDEGNGKTSTIEAPVFSHNVRYMSNRHHAAYRVSEILKTFIMVDDTNCPFSTNELKYYQDETAHLVSDRREVKVAIHEIGHKESAHFGWSVLLQTWLLRVFYPYDPLIEIAKLIPTNTDGLSRTAPHHNSSDGEVLKMDQLSQRKFSFPSSATKWVDMQYRCSEKTGDCMLENNFEKIILKNYFEKIIFMAFYTLF